MIKKLFFIFLGLILLFGLIFFIWRNYKENVILKQALQQQEQMIKQKEEQIQRLQEQLGALQKEQVLRERKIIVLKKQKEQIQKPKTVEELVKEFKNLGYEVTAK
jgi:ABC-type dipeptide/oligopeptide/nickel transport system permease component